MAQEVEAIQGKARAPAVYALLSDIGTPVSVFHKLSHDEPVAFLFESTDGDSRLARYSFIGVDPRLTVAFKGDTAVIVDSLAKTSHQREFANPLDVLKRLLEESGLHGFKPVPVNGKSTPSASYSAGSLLPALPFTGGFVGYLGYGATRCFEGIPQQDTDPFSVPDGFYGLYDAVVVFDHLFRRINVISHRGEEHARTLLDKLVAPCSLSPLPDRGNGLSDEQLFDDVTGPFSQQSFIEAVERGKEFIRQGQVFQIVVSQRFTMPVTSSPLDIYRVLQSVNPSPYAYLLKCPGFSYLGSSPETFVQCQNGQVVLRALAGTRPRGATEEEDDALAAQLRSDEKELAEHHMLVDLGRNDLGRVCRPGSIAVGEIATLTRYTHVMHLSTEIAGALKEGKSCFDVFQSCFPRGTVSGAPKIRAMQLLSELEPERRGIYSGVVGYFDFSGNMDGAIAIRSALIKDGYAHVNAGAGIVFDSRPDAEYQETRSKAKSVIKAIKLAERL